MAEINAERRCPFCGKFVVLGELPIVATNVVRRRVDENDEENPRRFVPASPAQVLRYVGDWPVIVEAPLSDAPGGWFGRAMDYVRPPALPPLSSVIDAAHLPARVCEHCQIPLPENLDDRPIYTIALIGTSGAGKTHLLASMLREAVYRQGLAQVGFTEFVFDGDTGKRFDNDYFVRLFRERKPLDSTQRDQDVVRKPLACKFTFREAAPALLLVHDIAGETLADRLLRARSASFLRRADAIIFLVDPLCLDRPDGRAWPVKGAHASAYFNQANLLTDCLSEMEPWTNGRTPVAITLSKSDLIQPLFEPCEFSIQPDMTSSEAWNQSLARVNREVQHILKAFDAPDLLAAGRRLPPDLVSFHAVAPIGSAPDPDASKIDVIRPIRCLDPLVTVLNRLPGLTEQLS